MRRQETLTFRLKSATQTSKRAAVATITMIAMIATVGAPFKWSLMLPPLW